MSAPDITRPITSGPRSRWYVAHKQPNAEMRAILNLERQGFTTCLQGRIEQRVTILSARKVRVTRDAGMIAAA